MSKLKIRLLSDACISSGAVYNSTIDTDICYDVYGLPYIPAKRLKGCLRETAEELRDWGVPIPVEEIFGTVQREGKLKLSNAMLVGYKEYVEDLEREEEKSLTHSQAVLELFTYIRAQTAIEDNTGAAKEGSLRKIRVLQKDLEFQLEYELSCEYQEAFQKCCGALKYMGMNRTRGYGRVEVKRNDDNKKNENKKKEEEQKEEISLEEGQKYRLPYEITLESPFLLRSFETSDSLDYIEGGKILGYILQQAGKAGDEIFEFLQEERLICSNAYIAKAGQRFLTVSASLFAIKDSESALLDKAAISTGAEENVLTKMCKGFYVEEKEKESLSLKKVEVQKEIRYHHTRPKDKSIGKVAREDEMSQFYQLESICQGQCFRGEIQGTTQQIQKIIGYIKQNPKARMGYGRSAEYGEVYIQHDQPVKLEDSKITEMLDSFQLKLNRSEERRVERV